MFTNTQQQFNMESYSSMIVYKRNGGSEKVSFDKVLKRIEKLVDKYQLKRINPFVIAQETIAGICNGQTTEEIDTYTSVKCAEHIQEDPQYDVLASAICISRLHKLTDSDFMKVTETLYNNIDAQGVKNSLISDEYYNFVKTNIEKIQSALNFEKDYNFSYFGFRTLERSYLHRIKTNKITDAHYKNNETDKNVKNELEQKNLMKNKYGYIVERPQCLFMRVAIALNINNIDNAIETYHHISNKHFIFGSPTLYNAGSKRQQLSSCFEENTEVFTFNSGVKKIKDVKIGDRVITHTGAIKTVKQVHKNLLNDRKMYNLKVNNTKNIVVTGNHKFLIIESNNLIWKQIDEMKTTDYILLPKLDDSYIIKKTWIDVTQILNIMEYQTVGDLVHIQNEMMRRFINIDDKLAYLLGIFCNKGYVLDNKIHIPIKNDNELLRLIEIFRIYGIIEQVSNNSISCTINSEYFSNLIMKLSELPPILFNTEPKFYGTMLSEMITEKYHDVSKISCSNKTLLNNLYHILRMHGLDVFFDNQSLTISNFELEHLEKSTTRQHVSRVLNIEELDIKPEYVYTLGVEDDHSYAVEGLICENCYLLDMADSIEGIAETIKDTMMISKWAGGIGIHVQDIRAAGSVIRGTNGSSDGIVPLARVLNNIAVYVNQGGKRKGAIACFCKDTQVFTANEGVKNIQDVKIGDLVVTHKNRLRPVVQTHKNLLGNRKIYKLEVAKNKDIYVTGNHRFWSKKYKSDKSSLGWNSIEELKHLMDNKKTTRQACYVSIPSDTGIEDTKNYKIDVMDYKDVILVDCIKELKILESGQIITISKAVNSNNHESTATEQPVNRIWNITKDFANFIGMWLGDGSIRKSKTGGNVLGITMTVHKDNKDEIAYIYKVCKEVFGCNITEHVSKISNATQITINSRIIGLIFMELFGSYFNGKKIANMIFSWPKRLINSLIAGLITTDGHISKKDYNATLRLSNKNLIEQIYHLCRNNGINVSIVECNAFTISIPLNKDIINQTHKLYNDNRITRCKQKFENNDSIDDSTFLKIINITEVDRNDEYVYTLGVEEDHSYTVEGLLVENCYTEPWHADIYEFCEMRKDSGVEHMRARDLFLAVWIPDIFMKRVENNEVWSLMCPDECPGLTDSFGREFEELYLKYEKEKKYKKQVQAQDLMRHMITCQIESGVPYFLSKDSANMKSNQKNIGTIKSSNLCVTGDTYILTDKGQLLIKDIVDQHVNVWNGQEWSEVDIRKTGVDQELVQVDFSNGVSLKCTPYHKFVLNNNVIKFAKELQEQDILKSCRLPYQNFNKDLFEKYYNHNDPFIGRLLLQTIGIDSYIKNNKLYLSDAGVLNKALLLCGDMSWRETDLINISKVTKLDVKEDVYCFTEPKRHMGMFNGILTMQCAEIILYSDKDEIAVCNLASLCLPSFIDIINGKPKYNYDKLYQAARVATRNLNNVIDLNYYPVDKAEKSNKKHRPIGVGVQGVADVYCIFEVAFDSPEAFDLNDRIFETIYFGCLTESCELAKQYGHYETFPGSPFSQGILQFHMWNKSVKDLKMNFDWDKLIDDIKKYGTRNSQLTALMPTASTSQIMGFNECFEPMTENIYTRTTLAGEYVIINKYLVEKLITLGLWTKQIRNELKFDGGSIQKINEIPDNIKNIYRTAFEMKQMKPIVDQACRRGIFVDQSASMNLFMQKPDATKLYLSHMYAWKNGLKTWIYYLRTQPATQAINFGLDPADEIAIKIKRGLITETTNNSKSDTNDPRKMSEINIPKNPKFVNCEGCSS